VRRLGGLPLAIEIAAPWVRLMPVAEITREIEVSLGWLEGGRQGRAHNLHDSFEHSWRLLGTAERRALVQLAPCPGGFTRDSAKALAGAPLALLASLVDKSLLRADESGRFAFHPLIRELALEKLDARRARAAAERRFAEHHLRLLARFAAFHAVDQHEALRVIGGEFSNLLAAWQWAVARRRLPWLPRVADALEGYLAMRGRQQFGADLFEHAASALDARRPSHQAALCRVQLARAAFAFRLGEFDRADAAAQAALAAARRTGDAFGVLSATNTLGVVRLRQGRTAEAAAFLRDVLRRARRQRDDAATALYAINLSRVELDLGNEAAGQGLLEEALTMSRQVGSLVGQQAALNELCRLLIGNGQATEALPLAREGLALCRSTGVLGNLSYFHSCQGEALLLLGDIDAALAHAHDALRVIAEGGDRSLEPTCRLTLAGAARQRGDFGASLAELKRAASAAAQTPRAQAYVIAEYARWCEGQGRGDDAVRLRCSIVGASTAPSPLRRWVEREIETQAGRAIVCAEPAPNLARSLALLSLEPPV
jgi:tetratricopeptide (TPR) repeat protein